MDPLDKQQTLEKLEEAISSSQFTFLVGKNRVPITIHADIVTNLSAPLAALINNGVMTESTTRVAVLDDVEDWVFRKFCQFAYTGSYSVKSATVPQVTRPNSSTSNHTNLTATTATTAMSPNNRTEDIRNRLSTTESGHTVSIPLVNLDMSPDFRCFTHRLWNRFSMLRSTSRSGHQSNTIYKTHIGVYLFATKYLIEPLRQRCLDYLHYELRYYAWHLGSSMLVKFLDSIYEFTTPYEPGGGCAMRDLIVRFAACHIWRLRKEESFEELVERRPEIALDLFEVLTE